MSEGTTRRKIALVPVLAVFLVAGFSALSGAAFPQKPKKGEKSRSVSPWLPFLTYYTGRVRVDRRLVDQDNEIWKYRVYNYGKGAMGGSFPREDPLYKTETVERAEWTVNGRIFPLTKDPATSYVEGNVDFSGIQPGSGNNRAVLRIFGTGDKLIFEYDSGDFQYAM